MNENTCSEPISVPTLDIPIILKLYLFYNKIKKYLRLININSLALTLYSLWTNHFTQWK